MYYTDSRVLFFWHRYGSSKITVADILREIKYACVKNDIILEVSWMPREDDRIKLADASCRESTDEFALKNRTYARICDLLKFKPEVDLFASTLLHRTPIFYSKVPSLGSSGANALNFPWNRKSYCHPPKVLMNDVFKKIEASNEIDMVLIFLKTNHDTDLKRFQDRNGRFRNYIKRILMFEANVHFPGEDPPRFMIAQHSWYAMRIVKDNVFCSLTIKDIFHFHD